MYSFFNSTKLTVAATPTDKDRACNIVAAEVCFALHTQASPGRHATEAYIAQRFAEQYGAQVRDFLPLLLSLSPSTKPADTPCAALGLHPASVGTCFLEQYLSLPVEQILSAAFHCPVVRTRVIEIGNLVATRSGSSYFLFAAMTLLLHEAGFQWLIFTATGQVKKIIRKMGFNPVEICEARPELLHRKDHQWGSYYDNQPKVMLGNLQNANQILTNSDTLQQLLAPHKPQLMQMAKTLRGYTYE